jgi:hypothetical protein
MNRAEAVQKLKGYAEAIRAMGATSLYVFGSTVRSPVLDAWAKSFARPTHALPLRDAILPTLQPVQIKQPE